MKVAASGISTYSDGSVYNTLTWPVQYPMSTDCILWAAAYSIGSYKLFQRVFASTPAVYENRVGWKKERLSEDMEARMTLSIDGLQFCITKTDSTSELTILLNPHSGNPVMNGRYKVWVRDMVTNATGEPTHGTYAGKNYTTIVEDFIHSVFF